MITLALLGLVASQGPAYRPLLGFNLDGSLVALAAVRWRPGTSVVRVPGGFGLHFDGVESGWMIPDDGALKIRDQLTISVWLNPESYVDRGPGAQILIRGDDRSGLDPYSLVLHGDGTIWFGIQNEANESGSVGCTLPLHKWTNIVATMSVEPQFTMLQMYVNGELWATQRCNVVPLGDLDQSYAPGLGVGNVQWDKGPHSQPYHGTLADLRVYNAVLTPKLLGFSRSGWIGPTR